MVTRIVEVIGATELFEARQVNAWPPFERVGRRRDAAGRWHLVRLIDFGTDRERSAGDETWCEEQARAFVSLRLATGQPLEVGEIDPPRRDTPLPPGNHYVPEGQLEVLPRLYLVEEALEGRALRLRPNSPAFAPAAARAALSRLRAWLATLPPSSLAPAHLDLELWLHRTGELEARPRFHYLPSVDFAGLPALAPRDSSLQAVVTNLQRDAGESGSLDAVVSAFGQTREWPRRRAPTTHTDSGLDVLADYVRRHLPAAPPDATLSLPDAPPEVRRWRTAPIVAGR